MRKITDSVIFRAVVNVIIILLLIIALLMNISLFTKYRSLAVVSGSMEPELPYGSMIVISPREVYKEGDIVTFRSLSDGLVKRFTHRIVSIEGAAAVTKGDANNSADPEPTPLSKAEGKVVFTVPLAGYLIMAFDYPAVKIGGGLVFLLWLALELELARRRSKKEGVRDEEGERTTA